MNYNVPVVQGFGGLLDDVYAKELKPIVQQTVADSVETGRIAVVDAVKQYKWELVGAVIAVGVIYGLVNYATSYLATYDAMNNR
jgi:hypothetical protein